MKRYLTGYSRNTLTVRDRQTNQQKTFKQVDLETAELLQTAIKQTNYNIDYEKSSKVTTKSIDDCKEWLHSVSKKDRLEYGWIKPEFIKWEQPKEKEEIHINNLSKQLDDILFNN